jgi:hypothetical protein
MRYRLPDLCWEEDSLLGVLERDPNIRFLASMSNGLTDGAAEKGLKLTWLDQRVVLEAELLEEVELSDLPKSIALTRLI